MKPQRPSPGFAAVLCLFPCLLAASAIVANQLEAPKQDELTVAAARAAINETFDRWGRARVERDKETMDAMLSPDFYVLLYGRKLSREQFINDISQDRSNSRITRFETDILTVKKNEKDWTVVVSEKVEVAILGSSG